MKAIVLVSGGLDSVLTIKIMQEQGVEPLALHFLIPFVKDDERTVAASPAARTARQLGSEFRVVPLVDDYLAMVRDPAHGYGKNFNPCIDCKILMLKHARRIMEDEGASFIATGEVVGQRPMSQYKQALAAIERKSGLEGLLVRPLSAKLMKPTVPEEKGWLDRERLYDIQGRGRTRQLELAKRWGIEGFSQPAGGCLLTDENFCRRARDLIEQDRFTVPEIDFIKYGRYFRLGSDCRLSLGRDEIENGALLYLVRPQDTVLRPASLTGPTAVLRGTFTECEMDVAARIVARYTKGPGAAREIEIRRAGDKQVLNVEPLSDAEIEKMRV